MELDAKIAVMDEHICSKCKFLDVTNYPTTIFGNGEIVGTEMHYTCTDIEKCKYLRNLFLTNLKGSDTNGDV